MSDNKYNKQYIKELEFAFGIENDVELAKVLGVKKEMIYNWVNRGDKIKVEILKNAFPALDMNYLITEGKEGQLLKESPLDRILKAFKILNINLETVYKKSGVIMGTLGKKTNTYENISFDSLEKILLAFPQISREYILTGTGNMFVEKSLVNEDKSQYNLMDMMKVEIAEKMSEFDTAYNNLKSVMSKYNFAI